MSNLTSARKSEISRPVVELTQPKKQELAGKLLNLYKISYMHFMEHLTRHSAQSVEAEIDRLN
jgi:hypothetical protein